MRLIRLDLATSFLLKKAAVEHRSGKDHVQPDYTERNGTDFEHERSHV